MLPKRGAGILNSIDGPFRRASAWNMQPQSGNFTIVMIGSRWGSGTANSNQLVE